MPNLKASNIRPFIPAKDFALSKQFYTALGWETVDVGRNLALVRLSAEQHFYLQDYYLRDFAENSMLHVTVQDVQAWHAHIVSILRDGDFADARVQAPSRQPYGASVVFLHDPSGVLLQLCEWDC